MKKIMVVLVGLLVIAWALLVAGCSAPADEPAPTESEEPTVTASFIAEVHTSTASEIDDVDNGVDEGGTLQSVITPKLLADFETYVKQNREALNVPGAAVAIVQGGEIVYAEGFGVKEVGSHEPVTADTVFSIGSLDKALTSMMVAGLVDDGLIAWDTPLVEVMPQFELADD